MTKQDILEFFDDINDVYNNPNKHDDLSKMLDMLAQQEPCEDCINRSEAIKYLNTNMAWYDEDGEIADSDEKLKAITDLINGVPSAQPKTGYWEWVQYDYNPKLGNWHCSECRCVVVECVDKNEKSGIPLYKYCPQCGAKMER